MNNALVVSLAVATLALASSCGNKPPVDKPKPAVSQAPTPTLDLVIGGPFVFFQGANCPPPGSKCLSVWIPNVKGHTVVVGIDKGDDLKRFDPGDYDFTVGIRPSNTTALIKPVLNASIYPASMKIQNVAATPKKKPFATILLPAPRQIVSWNADPMTISSNGSAVSANATSNLATLTVLRYDYQDGDTLQVKSGSDSFWKPEPETIGTERLMVIGFLPENPTGNEDEHTHAREAFKATAAMLGLKWKVSFDAPPVGFQRNRPLDGTFPLPQDLLDILDKTSAAGSNTAKASVSTSTIGIFGKINDCKAPAILITQ
jgi:hypothetical protein